MPHYRDIYQQLRAEITRSPRGLKWLPSEPALEKRFHVSRITIRHAVNLLSRAGLVQKAQGKGTLILPVARPQERRPLWVVLSQHVNGGWTDPFYAPMAAAISNGAKESGLPSYRFRDSEKEAFASTLKAARATPPAVFFLGKCLPSLSRLAMSFGALVVHLDGGEKSSGHLWVGEDAQAGARLAVRAIQKWRCQRLAILYALGNSTWEKRLSYFSGELFGGRLKPLTLLPICISSVGSDEFGRAYRTVLRYLGEGPLDFDMILGISDRLAKGALAALREKKIKCPGQVSVLGWDGLGNSHGGTSLTTVAVGPDKMGHEALRLALRLDQAPCRFPVLFKVKPDFHRGDTTPI